MINRKRWVFAQKCQMMTLMYINTHHQMPPYIECSSSWYWQKHFKVKTSIQISRKWWVQSPKNTRDLSFAFLRIRSPRRDFSVLNTSPYSNNPLLASLYDAPRRGRYPILNVELTEKQWSQGKLPVLIGDSGMKSECSLVSLAFLSSSAAGCHSLQIYPERVKT